VDRLRDVLDLLIAEILEIDLDLVPDLVEDIAGHADAAGVRQSLQARGNVDAVAVDVVAVDDDVADVDADAVDDSALDGDLRVIFLDRGLQLDGEKHRVDHAGEFHQRAIAHQFDGAAAIGPGPRLDELRAVGFQGRQGAALVGAHEAAVPDHVGGEDRRQAAFLFFFLHRLTSPPAV